MNFSLFLTNQCNMDCFYCYENNKQRRYMDYATIDQTINFIVNQYKSNPQGELSIVTHGGEPLLAFDQIKYLITGLDNRFDAIRYIITTNATLLNDEMIDFLAEHYAEISVSIDGTESAHNLNRVFHNGKGTYNIVVKNSRKLLKKRNDVKARMTVNPQSVDFLSEGIKQLLDIGFRTIVPVSDQFSCDWTSEKMNNLYIQGLNIIDYVKTYSDITNVGFIDDALVKRMNAPCDGGTTTFSIDTDGSVFPCLVAVGISEFKIGNVQDGLDLDAVRLISDWATVKNESCDGCSRYDYCNATRCKIINKIHTGDLHRPIPATCGIENVKVQLSERYLEVFPN